MHTPFSGPETPSTAQQMQELHAALGIEHVNVFKMKAPPGPDAHPKVLRAYWLFRTLPDMWRDQFSTVLQDDQHLGLQGPSGMAFDEEGYASYLQGLNDANAITQSLLYVSNPTIDAAINRFGARCQATLHPDFASETGVPERYAAADTLLVGLVTNPHTLSVMGEKRWGTDAATRQGFRAARDAEWRTQGVLPRVSVLGYDHDLTAQEAEALSEGSVSVVAALADAHEDIFLAIRSILRGTPDHMLERPYDWKKFLIADRGDGRLTLEIKPEVFDEVLRNPPSINEPWTGCPSIPFLRKYHEWSVKLAKRFYLPHIPRLQADIRRVHTVPIQQPDAREDALVKERVSL